MTTWTFSCETRSEIPLPPEYTFPRAFNYLNPEKNSFYILERDNGNYIQCGGSKKACTVEMRIYHSDGSYKHYVVGRKDSSSAPATVQMSAGVVKVQEREVLDHWQAIKLFERFFSGNETVPSEYVLREASL
jgi:hypothetical protein